MLEHAIYSVISPEGAASILWRDSGRAQDAATSMKITAQDLLRLGVIDAIVAEPTGGAHREPQAAIKATGDAIQNALKDLGNMGPAEVPGPPRGEVPGHQAQALAHRAQRGAPDGSPKWNPL